MTDFAPDKSEPILVKGSAAPVVMSETFKIVGTAAFAFAADRLLHSDLAIAAVLAGAGPILIWGWGLWHRIRTWGAARHMAALLPDDVARVGRSDWWWPFGAKA